MSSTPSTSLSDALVNVTSLRSQHPIGLLGLPGDGIELTWAVTSSRAGSVQLAYQIHFSSTQDFSDAQDAGIVESSESIKVAAPGTALGSREIRYFRVRIATQVGWSNWSDTFMHETGLVAASDFSGVGIGDDSLHSAPAPILRKEFTLKAAPTKARLYVTSNGLNEMSINGLKVGDEFLSPGWTTYHQRALVATHDVTHLLGAGKNALGAKLGDGWWRGKLGFRNDYNEYGTKIALLAQLEVTYPDGSSETIATDSSWKCSTAELLFGDIYDGSTIDLNLVKAGWNQAGFDDSSWAAVVVSDFKNQRLVPRIAEPVRQVGQFTMKLIAQSDRTLLASEQNISGWVRLVVDGKKGQTVVIRHAEVLEPGDKLHTKALRSAKATDKYVLDRDGRHVLEPEFTFHGFQYADVVTEATVVSATSIAISSDIAPRATFNSSDTRLNRLHQNVVWSQRDNFVSVPTDCPQRDERLGWTGDAQAFAGTANTLFDSESFWRSWLIDLALDQDENGDVGAVIPDIIKTHEPMGDWIVQGRAGWADAATIVPFANFEHYADKEVLRAQLTSMRRWTDALHNRREGKEFLPTEFQFGDWCDPDAQSDRPWDSKVSADFVANAFFANTAALMAHAEKLVGTPEGVLKYSQMADELKASIWSKMGEEAKTTTAGCSIAIEFNIVPAAEKQALADHLANMVEKDQGKIATGFLGTPLILHALSKNGHERAAYMMLMRREIRSWLYQVDQGATTIWERWDAIREDGSIHTGAMDSAPEGQEDSSMISFNHYAYGAVIDWVYRNVAGLAPAIDEPGYRKIVVAPKPAQGFSFAEASIKTRLGETSIHWAIQQTGDLAIRLVVPFGATAHLNLPVTDKSLVTINGKPSSNGESVAHGDYVIVISNPEIVHYK